MISREVSWAKRQPAAVSLAGPRKPSLVQWEAEWERRDRGGAVPVRGEPQVRRGTPGCGRTQRRQRLTGEWAEAVQQDQPFPLKNQSQSEAGVWRRQ